QVVELHFPATLRTRQGRLQLGRDVGSLLDQSSLFARAVGTQVGSEDRPDLTMPAEIRDHVELIDERHGAPLEHERGAVAVERVDEIDPLPYARRIDPVDSGEVENDASVELREQVSEIAVLGQFSGESDPRRIILRLDGPSQ